MKSPSAFQLLRSFSEKELNHLSRFLLSPVFVPDQSYGALLTYWRENRGRPIDKVALFQTAYPKKTFLERDWHLWMSRFQVQIERFLVWQELQKDDFNAIPLLLRNLRRRKLTGFFQRTIRKARSLRQRRVRNEARMLYLDYDFEQEYYDFVSSPNRKERTNLQEVSDKLDHFFVAEKLKQACLAHSRNLANAELYEVAFMQEVVDAVLAQSALQDIPAVAVYFACYQAFVLQGDRAAFQHLRSTMERYQNGFPNQEIRDIYLLAINYCIRALNRSEVIFIEEAFFLYQQSLDKGYLLEDGHIPESAFMNMVSLGIRLNAFDWVDSFIADYGKLLTPTFREPVSGFSIAKLAYERGELDEAMKVLARVETKAPFLYLGAKTLQIKVFYESGETEALESLLESLRIYLQRRNDLGYRKQHYQHLLRFSKRLLQRNLSDPENVKILRTDIQATEDFQEKEWFLKQLRFKL